MQLTTKQMATKMDALKIKAGQERNTELGAELTGEGAEHDKVRAYLKAKGPREMLDRLRQKHGPKELATELELAPGQGLKTLAFEVGPLDTQNEGGDCFMRVRCKMSGELCLDWPRR